MNKRSIYTAILTLMVLIINAFVYNEPLANDAIKTKETVAAKYIDNKYIKMHQEKLLNDNVDVIKNEDDIVTASYEPTMVENNQESETQTEDSNNIQQQEEEISNDNSNTSEENTNQEEVINDDDGTIAYASTGVDPYPGYMTKYMDLNNRMDISIDQMNSLIDYWLKGRDSKLKGEGEAFVKASQITGLDPIFLLALAAQESGWVTSKLHSRKNNPYSIAMYDENPECGYILGDEFGSGIVNGAIWINENYYCQGQNTLHSMIYGAKQYSSATDDWISSITSIMNTSYKYLLN